MLKEVQWNMQVFLINVDVPNKCIIVRHWFLNNIDNILSKMRKRALLHVQLFGICSSLEYLEIHAGLNTFNKKDYNVTNQKLQNYIKAM